MRPVNLIPTDERPGQRKPMRGGPLAYIVVGALAAAVIGVAVLAVTNNQISETKAEITRLEDEKATVEARAQALDAYTQFHAMREQRDLTITNLADSRFDWQRVMRELAIVLPGNVWLTNLTGTASPGSTVEGAASVAMRSSIPGPALELNGCATGQDARRRLRAGAQADRRSDAGRRAVLDAGRRIRQRIVLPNACLHRPVRDRRRLRRGPRPQRRKRSGASPRTDR